RLLRPPGRGRQAEDAGHRRLHAEARDDRLRGAQEPPAVRPGLGLTDHLLTTRYLVRRYLISATKWSGFGAQVGPVRQVPCHQGLRITGCVNYCLALARD